MSIPAAELTKMGFVFGFGNIYHLDYPDITFRQWIEALDQEIVVTSEESPAVRMYLANIWAVKEITDGGYSQPQLITRSGYPGIADGLRLSGRLIGLSADPTTHPEPLPSPVDIRGFVRFGTAGGAHVARVLSLQVFQFVQHPMSTLIAHCAQ